MKKTFRILMFAISSCIFLSNSSAHERDTLRCHFADSTAYTINLYVANNGGYICGVNGSGNLEIAQKYGLAPAGDTVGDDCTVGDEHELNEVLVVFGAKKVGNPNDSVFINVYSSDPVTGNPDSLLGISFPVQMNFIDTSTTSVIYTQFVMQQPVIFTDSFFLSVVYSNGIGDTVGIMSNTAGQAQNSQLCWIKNNNANWSSLLAADSLDVDAMIFPVVGDVTIGINELTPVVSHLITFPNPSTQTTTIEYTVTSPVQQLDFRLFDITGKIIYSFTQNNISIGKNQLTLDTGSLQPGIYYYSFESNGNKFNGRLEII